MKQTTEKIHVQKMAQPKHYGDWHDKPLMWEVIGPGQEIQRFSTKKNALSYASSRRKSATATEAICNFLHLIDL